VKEGKTQKRKVSEFATTSKASDDESDTDWRSRSASARRTKSRSRRSSSLSRSSFGRRSIERKVGGDRPHLVQKSFADKHRIEIRNRRRKPNETLSSLHIDIRRLATLAFPSMEHKAREVVSCNYFLDALADPDFATKIRERHPEDLDSALRIALQLEVWAKDSDRLREAARGPVT